MAYFFEGRNGHFLGVGRYFILGISIWMSVLIISLGDETVIFRVGKILHSRDQFLDRGTDYFWGGKQSICKVGEVIYFRLYG